MRGSAQPRLLLGACMLPAAWMLLAAASPGWGQTVADPRLLDIAAPDRSPESPLGPGGDIGMVRELPSVVQAGPVDPALYVLGPGDVLELELWGRLARVVVLTVGPEGTVFLPEAGAFEVAGRTLAWSRDRILGMVAETFRGVRANVRLIRLRSFKVYVTGFVKAPGAIEVTSTARASEAVSAAAGLSEGGSRRNIRIERRDGSIARLDLDSFEFAGRQDLNPTLVDGDVILVRKAKEFVEVSGAVARPGRLELGADDSLSTLLELSGGLLPAAVRDRALAVRFVSPSERESSWVNLAEIPGGGDFPLRDGDHLFVHYRPSFHALPVVSIYGEIERPGQYPIVLARDRFSDLIRWAGGFRPLANRSGMYLLRELADPTEKDPEFDRLVRLSRSDMTESEYVKFQTRLAERKNTFRLDWSVIPKQGGPVDPLLQAGDVIRVDQLIPTVRVEGQVRRPGFIDFAPGRSLEEYVQLSGGFTDRASRNNTRVARSLTGQVIPARSVKAVQPGDFIWVPERRDADVWGAVRDVVTVAGQVAVIIFTLSRR